MHTSTCCWGAKPYLGPLLTKSRRHLATSQRGTKYIASHTQKASNWQPSVFLDGDAAGKIAQIKHQGGPDLHVWGSGHLIQTLLKHDLVDVFWLMIYPITLGSGKRLFAEGTIPARFTMTESQVTSKSVMIVNYERTGTITTGVQ